MGPISPNSGGTGEGNVTSPPSIFPIQLLSVMMKAVYKPSTKALKQMSSVETVPLGVSHTTSRNSGTPSRSKSNKSGIPSLFESGPLLYMSAPFSS